MGLEILNKYECLGTSRGGVVKMNAIKGDVTINGMIVKVLV